MPLLRSFLALSRGCNLPTVWSNCLAGWWLGGGGPLKRLPFLLFGASCLYLGGAFLNDAWDADYDCQHRRGRPVPMSAMSAPTVAFFGGAFMILGLASLSWLGIHTAVFCAILVASILLFDALHRVITFPSLLLGACRFWLYIAAASAGREGVTGWSIWAGIALAAYVTALGTFDGKGDRPDYPAALLLGVPIVLAMVMNVNQYREAGFLLSAVLGLWIIRCLRYTFWSSERDTQRTRSGLLAGIVFVDWLAIADAPPELSVTLIGLFLFTLACGRLAAAAAP